MLYHKDTVLRVLIFFEYLAFVDAQIHQIPIRISHIITTFGIPGQDSRAVRIAASEIGLRATISKVPTVSACRRIK